MKSGAKRPLALLLGEMKDYKVTHPITFSLLTHLLRGGANVKTALHVHSQITAFNSFVMRAAFSVTTLSPSLYAEKFAELARKVYQATDTTDVRVAQDLQNCHNAEMLMDNGRFSEIMKSISINSAIKAKTLLAGIYKCDPLVLNSVHVEHVLPKMEKHWKNWAGFPDNEKLLYVNRIGNLALLPNEGQRLEEDWQAAYKNKIKVYKSSPHLLTQSISSYGSQWTPATIEKRQQDLVRRILKTWPV